ncbi:hypothetical protein ACTWPT_05315 [Nonomuraea sp. 3N208]|uniref:hypothetical protein n=1 Tax=Nonomuraea sp. 3N208 TaxID=3457421 RepID=UPI003FCC3C94
MLNDPPSWSTEIGIIIGSVRPGRNGVNVARWVHDLAVTRVGYGVRATEHLPLRSAA